MSSCNRNNVIIYTNCSHSFVSGNVRFMAKRNNLTFKEPKDPYHHGNFHHQESFSLN